eukprot:TRINITY_DN9905_c0_g2_i1.p1 TRINITY_DN9905_c0_g2~~TRINITY_DN9905_c0_g2_i1.p1  ORF type:complete len:521 (+),score=64.23 TRINITY_DN9905_c0_g2_i1:11-1573(+)
MRRFVHPPTMASHSSDRSRSSAGGTISQNSPPRPAGTGAPRTPITRSAPGTPQRPVSASPSGPRKGTELFHSPQQGEHGADSSLQPTGQLPSNVANHSSSHRGPLPEHHWPNVTAHRRDADDPEDMQTQELLAAADQHERQIKRARAGPLPAPRLARNDSDNCLPSNCTGLANTEVGDQDYLSQGDHQDADSHDNQFLRRHELDGMLNQFESKITAQISATTRSLLNGFDASIHQKLDRLDTRRINHQQRLDRLDARDKQVDKDIQELRQQLGILKSGRVPTRAQQAWDPDPDPMILKITSEHVVALDAVRAVVEPWLNEIPHLQQPGDPPAYSWPGPRDLSRVHTLKFAGSLGWAMKQAQSTHPSLRSTNPDGSTEWKRFDAMAPDNHPTRLFLGLDTNRKQRAAFSLSKQLLDACKAAHPAGDWHLQKFEGKVLLDWKAFADIEPTIDKSYKLGWFHHSKFDEIDTRGIRAHLDRAIQDSLSEQWRVTLHSLTSWPDRIKAFAMSAGMAEAQDRSENI